MGATTALASPALAAFPELDLQPDPFAFPAGRAPGVDQSHPASLGLLFSGVTIAPRMIDLTKPQGATQLNTINSAMNGVLGPCITSSGTNGSLEYSGRSTAVPTSVTMAALYFPDSSISDTAFISNGSVENTATEIGIGGAKFLIWASSSNFAQVGTLVAATPYFFVASFNSTTINSLILNLSNGNRQQATQTGFAPVGGDGTFRVGTRANQILGQLAASMYSANNFLSLLQLQTWAADPWAFWYPRMLNNSLDIK